MNFALDVINFLQSCLRHLQHAISPPWWIRDKGWASHSRTACCGKPIYPTDDGPRNLVEWNPWNDVVQCDACGTVYGPVQYGDMPGHATEADQSAAKELSDMLDLSRASAATDDAIKQMAAEGRWIELAAAVRQRMDNDAMVRAFALGVSEGLDGDEDAES